VSLLAYWGVALPLGWVLSGWFGPAGIWLGFFVALMGAGIALTRRFMAATA
jgi:multidrug resistance protein, MATE family